MASPEPQFALGSEVSEESFVVLGSSPSNLYSHVNLQQSIGDNVNTILPNHSMFESQGMAGQPPMTQLDQLKQSRSQLNSTEADYVFESLTKATTPEASQAYMAHFQLGTTPSALSRLTAASHITEDMKLESIRQRFGEILDENIILKDTLKQNQDAMKDQFKTIATWQEDMMKTHKLHKSKFDETKLLITKLRSENQQLRSELESRKALKSISPLLEANGGESNDAEAKDASADINTSVYEFIVHKDDFTIGKLAEQIELLEKQRRQLTLENDSLHFQNESLSDTVERLTVSNEDLKQAITDLELKLSEPTNTSENVLHSMEEKNEFLTAGLKAAQLKILELENGKLTYSVQKNEANEHVKRLKADIQELESRIRDAHTVSFHPVRFSVSLEEHSDKSEYSSFETNVKEYDCTLKHLATLLNQNSRSVCEITENVNKYLKAVGDHSKSDQPTEITESLSILELITELYLKGVGAHSKSDQPTEITESLSNLKLITESQQKNNLEHVAQIKATMSIFEKIFKNYQDVLARLKKADQEKLTYSVQKNEANEHVKRLKADIQELESRIRDAHTVSFHPVRFSVSSEEHSDESEYISFERMLMFETNVKEYDCTLKHLAPLLNQNSRSVCEITENVNKYLKAVCDHSKSDQPTEITESLSNLKLITESQQKNYLDHVAQIKATMSIFEKIFENYQDVLAWLKKADQEKDVIVAKECAKNELLSAAESELTLLRGTIANLKTQSEETEVYRTQLEIYKNDFEAERSARESMVTAKEQLATDLKLLHRRYNVLQAQMDALQGQKSSLGTSSIGGVSMVPKSKFEAHSSTNHEGEEDAISPSHYCPICDKSFRSVKFLQDHVDACLDRDPPQEF